MGYLGNKPAESYASFEKQVFTIVNSQTAYTLDHSVVNENDIRLVVNNVVQEPGSGKAYTASGTSLTLSAALVNGTDTMYAVFLGKAVQTINPPNASVGSAQIADDLISGKTVLASEPADTDEFLVSDAGTLKRLDYSLIKSSPGMVHLVTASQSSGVSEVDISSTYINSTYDTYYFEGNFLPATDSQYLTIRFFVSGTVIDGSSTYSRASFRYDASFDYGATDAGTKIYFNSTAGQGNASGEFQQVKGFLTNVTSTTYNTMAVFDHLYKGTSGNWRQEKGSGILHATSAVNGIRFLYDSGNVAQSQIKIWGIKTS